MDDAGLWLCKWIVSMWVLKKEEVVRKLKGYLKALATSANATSCVWAACVRIHCCHRQADVTGVRFIRNERVGQRLLRSLCRSGTLRFPHRESVARANQKLYYFYQVCRVSIPQRIITLSRSQAFPSFLGEACSLLRRIVLP